MYYNFNRLYLIESLPSEDLQTGRILYEDLFKWHNENGNSFDVEYYPIKNIKGLDLLLDIIIFEYSTKFLRPIIHFDAHGNEEGICLQSGEIYNWNQLLDRLAEINYYSHNNLIMVLALCRGGYVLSAIENHITKRAPFFAAIYSFDIVLAGELLKGFIKFYTEIFISKDGMIAMDKLCNEISNETSHFKLHSCVYLLKLCFQMYLEDHCSQKMVQSKTEEFITKLKQSNKMLDINKVRPLIKKEFKRANQKEFFTLARDQFCMIDIYPENKERIKLDFQDLEE